ncbi:MAG: hypothetical protein HXS48_19050 [Theionarchaea archaeon]|nr:MAG: hypothetical protein AYK19_18905 [Theionarchaea archaeon DG-70-1]MBU7029040.1 hypothetical protein [Theionarchaea archaeon]
MKVDVDCTMNGEAEISISLLERVSREEFEEFTELMRREGFEYDHYDHSNSFTTDNPRMLKAMLEFLDKEFEVSGTLRGTKKYTWDERDAFVKEFTDLHSGQ